MFKAYVVFSGALLAASLMAAPSSAAVAEWKIPEVTLPAKLVHPAVACTPAELERLRAAWRGGSADEKAVVADRIARADRALATPIVLPPRGGQHNQWYQCDKCQLALRTLDDTHHQCPKCKTVYSGMPYDDVIFAHKHSENLSNLEAAAWAYALTREPKYADYAAKILLGYAARYRQYPYHSSDWRGKPGVTGGHLAEQTLNEANMLAGEIAPAYDLLYDSKVLSPADHEAIRTGLILPMLENIDKYKAGKGNWQTWHNAAMIAGGAVLGEAAWIRKAIADPKNGFAFQLGESVSADGMWYENSWGYHYYTLSAMVDIVEGARRLGLDLWSHPALKKMFTLPVEYAMPDGSLPRFGDDVQSSVRGAARYLETAWPAYHDTAMLPYMYRRPAWESVLLGRKIGEATAEPRPLTSSVFRSAGHAILRAKGDAGLAAAITFGPYGGFHGHFDKLSFVFFGQGRELAVDPGRARSQAYRLPIHRDWYKATLGHNAVLADRASQKPATGALECFVANVQYAAVVARCDEAYPGVKHRRLLCLTPAYLLVFDDLAAGEPHRFDWLYHNRGEAVECAAATQEAALEKAFAGAEYIREAKTGTTAEAIRAKFAGSEVATHLVLDAAPDTEVLAGDGPGGSILDRVPLVMVSRRGAGARFAAVLEPVAAGKTPAVTAVSQSRDGGNTRITVRRGEASDIVTLNPAGAVAVTVNGAPVLSGKSE